jgi:hypothetical protein
MIDLKEAAKVKRLGQLHKKSIEIELRNNNPTEDGSTYERSIQMMVSVVVGQ